MRHLAWRCDAPQGYRRQRHGDGDANLRAVRDAAAHSDEEDPAWSRALVADSRWRFPRTAAEGSRRFSDQWEPLETRIFTDGSCLRPSDPALARAGWAATCSPSGLPPRAVWGNVPLPNPQDSGAVEILGVAEALKHCGAQEEVHVWTDPWW